MPFHYELEPQIRDFIVPYMLLNGLVGILMVFFGYRVWTVLLALMGLGLGFLAGILLGVASELQEPAMVLGVGVLGAIVGAALLAGVRLLGTFVAGGSISISIVAMLLDVMNVNRDIDQEAAATLAIIVFLVGGLVIVACGRGGIIAASSLSGAQAVVVTGSVLIASEGELALATIAPFSLVELSITGGIAILGMMIQYRLTGGETKGEDRAQAGFTNAEKTRDNGGVPLDATTDDASSKDEPPRADNIEERLAELQRLRDGGLITKDAYINKRNAILSEM